MLLYYSIYYGESYTCSLPGLFCSKKWLKYLFLELRIHTFSGVRVNYQNTIILSLSGQGNFSFAHSFQGVHGILNASDGDAHEPVDLSHIRRLSGGG